MEIKKANSEITSLGFWIPLNDVGESSSSLPLLRYMDNSYTTSFNLYSIKNPPRTVNMAQHKHIINVISKQVIPPLSSKLHKGQAGTKQHFSRNSTALHTNLQD